MTNPLHNRFADPFYGYNVKIIITSKKKTTKVKASKKGKND